VSATAIAKFLVLTAVLFIRPITTMIVTVTLPWSCNADFYVLTEEVVPSASFFDITAVLFVSTILAIHETVTLIWQWDADSLVAHDLARSTACKRCNKKHTHFRRKCSSQMKSNPATLIRSRISLEPFEKWLWRWPMTLTCELVRDASPNYVTIKKRAHTCNS